MKYFIQITLFFFILFTTYTYSYAELTNNKLQSVYNNFITKVEKKYSAQKQLVFVKKLSQNISNILDTRELSTAKKELLGDLLIINNEQIFEYEMSNEIMNQDQIILESKKRNDLFQNLQNIIIPSYITFQFDPEKVFQVNKDLEFIQNASLQRFDLQNYMEITGKNYGRFENRDGVVLVFENGNTWFVEEYSFKKKTPYSELSSYFSTSISYDVSFNQKGSQFEGYYFSNYYTSDDTYGVYIDGLKKSGISFESTLLYKDKNGKYNYVVDYSKKIIINADQVYGVSQKKDLLNQIVSDNKLIDSNYTDTLLSLEQVTRNITQGMSKSEKIVTIYKYITDTISYSENPSFDQVEIFSGLDTYKNKVGVCEGYAKLFVYMLLFAGIQDVEFIAGDVVDAEDFPEIGHAWVRIGDKYYDPTFDDPVGDEIAKKEYEYKYFGLPRDIFYANRFDLGSTPESLESKSMQFRQNFVAQRYSYLVDKYRLYNYEILNEPKFFKDNNLKIGSEIHLEELGTIIETITITEEISGETYYFSNGEKQNISGIEYFSIDDSVSLNLVLQELDYNLSGVKILQWNLPNGTQETRIGFNIQ